MSLHRLIWNCVRSPRSSIFLVSHQRPVLNCLFLRTFAHYDRICDKRCPQQADISRICSTNSNSDLLIGNSRQLLTLPSTRNSQSGIKFSSSAFYCNSNLGDNRGNTGRSTPKQINRMISIAKLAITGGTCFYLFVYMWIHRHQARQQLKSSLEDYMLAQQQLSALIGVSAALGNTLNVDDSDNEKFIEAIPPENESDKFYPLGQKITLTNEGGE